MKKLIYIIAALAVIAFTVPQLYNKLNESQDNFSQKTETESSCEEETAPAEKVFSDESEVLYIGEYKGRVGIWKNPASKPYLVLDTYTFALPESDRKMIEKGFYITAEELDGLICDYTG